MTEPPDNNLRRTIVNDQEAIDLLLDEGLHFKERCLRYETQNVRVEYRLLSEYKCWTHSMLQDAVKRGDSARMEFFQLVEEARVDFSAVELEWERLDKEQEERIQRPVALKLEPLTQREWTKG